MKAMIFAAGLGSRLHPLTTRKPKALVQYKEKILLQSAIEYLRDYGVTEIIINVHHFAEQIIKFINAHDFKIPISISDERNLLLETGGGLKFARHFFDENAFILYNVDVISDLNLKALITAHKANNSLATLVVRKRDTQRYLMFDEEDRLCGWENKKTGQIKIRRPSKSTQSLAFSGIHIVKPEIFDLIPDVWEQFSMIDLYLHLAKDNCIKAFLDRSPNWLDIGKAEHLNYLT